METNQIMYKDVHAHGAYMGSWAVLGFLVFLALIWAVWYSQCKNHDHHTNSMLATKEAGYHLGYVQKQLNDTQYQVNKIAETQQTQFDYALINGFASRTCSQPIGCQPPRGYGYGYSGGIINGSRVDESRNFQSENSQFAGV